MADTVSYIPGGQRDSSISSEVQGWREDSLGGDGAIAGRRLLAGVCIIGAYVQGGGSIEGRGKDGTIYSVADLKPGFFAPQPITLTAIFKGGAGSVAVAYLNPSFTALGKAQS